MATYSNYVVSSSSSDSESEQQTTDKNIDMQPSKKADTIESKNKTDNSGKRGDDKSDLKSRHHSRSRSRDRKRHSDDKNEDKERSNSRRRSPNDKNRSEENYRDRRDRGRIDYQRFDRRDRNFNDRNRCDNSRRGGFREPKKNFQETSNKLKEQVERRKMLWKQGSQEKKVADHWSAMLSTCTDEKQAEKLKKLIGLKASESDGQNTATADSHSAESSEAPTTSTVGGASSALSETTRQKQEELFRNLNQQYEMGRMSTHTHRGLGLGFGSQMAEYASQIQNLSNQNQAGHQ